MDKLEVVTLSDPTLEAYFGITDLACRSALLRLMQLAIGGNAQAKKLLEAVRLGMLEIDGQAVSPSTLPQGCQLDIMEFTDATS